MQPSPRQPGADQRLRRSETVALDALRGAAALVVFLHHANIYRLDNGWFGWLRPDMGHSAVVVFFVLSGYVIAASAARSRSGIDFGIKRFARLYSVAVPAVLLTYFLAAVLHATGLPSGAPEYQFGKPWIYIGLALTFAGQLWKWSEPVFMNDPYWSLHYEAWYYLLFGLAFFLRGPWRWGLAGLAFLVMGPRIWALLPIWLGGAFVFWLREHRAVPMARARLLVLAAVAALVAIKATNIEVPLNNAALTVLHPVTVVPLYHSAGLAGDFLLGLAMMLLVYAIGPAQFRYPRPLAWVGTKLAAVSYSLYLVHLPLLLFFAAVLKGPPLVGVALSFVCAVGFGAIFERQREPLARLCRRMLMRQAAVRA